MDEAAVFTIHGFCQRSLSENAFEANLPFESELLEDDSEIMQKLTDDFWRRRFAKAPRSLVFKLNQQKITPDSLLKDIFRHVGKPYLSICGPESEEVKAEKWKELEPLFKSVISIWESEGEIITGLLLDKNVMNGNKFRQATVEKICHQMGKLLSLVDINKDLIASFEKFKQSYVDVGVKAKQIPPKHEFFDRLGDFF